MSERDKENAKRLASELLIALGEHIKNGSLTLHFDKDGLLKGTRIEKHQQI